MRTDGQKGRHLYAFISCTEHKKKDTSHYHEYTHTVGTAALIV